MPTESAPELTMINIAVFLSDDRHASAIIQSVASSGCELLLLMIAILPPVGETETTVNINFRFSLGNSIADFCQSAVSSDCELEKTLILILILTLTWFIATCICIATCVCIFCDDYMCISNLVICLSAHDYSNILSVHLNFAMYLYLHSIVFEKCFFLHVLIIVLCYAADCMKIST